MAHPTTRLATPPFEDHPDAYVANGFPLLQFDRPIDGDLLLGFALSWNSALTLIQVVETSQYQLNGYAIFRNSDVKRWRAIPNDEFYARAAVLQSLRPAVPAGLTITSMKEAISTAGKVFPLLTVHRERIKRGVCYVGKLQRTSQRSVTLRPISPEAAWEEEESYLLRDITLVEFGGAYERLLDQLAKPLPIRH
jgi:hypothetical protein